jgi:hypothetical protein
MLPQIKSVFSKMQETIWQDVEEVEQKPNDFHKMNVYKFADKFNLDIRYITFINDFLLPFIVHDSKVPFVAGGYLRRWMQREDFDKLTCDIDVYFQENRKTFVKYLFSCGAAKLEKPEGYGNSAFGIMINGKKYEFQCMSPVFNIIHSDHGFQTHLQTYDSFCSMAVYDPAKEEIHYHKDFPEHAIQEIYEFNPNCRKMNPVIQMGRLIKFVGMGYKVSYDCKKNLSRWIQAAKDQHYTDDAYQQ